MSKEWHRTIKPSKLDSFLDGLFARGYSVRVEVMVGKVRVFYW